MRLNERDKRNFIITGCIFAAFLLFTILVKTVHVAAIGPQGSEVGFAGINGFFMNHLPYRKFFYKLAEVLGLLVLLVVAAFGVVGVLQLLKGKSLWAVDTRILLLGVFYVIVFILYILFDKIAVNYRPVIIDAAEGLEPSYPSSHTMLACCVMSTAWLLLPYYLPAFVPNEKYLKYARIACLVIMALVVLTRFLSGVHWFTDIIGGILLSAALVMLYYSFYIMSEGAAGQRGKHEK